jgi:two-component system chemotaxis response regulator CheB
MLVERRGTIALSVDEPVKFSRPSIDVLFESAAEAFGDGVVGIVLSGTSSDGASGLRRVVEAGGIAIVQAPETAQQATMPAAALLQVPAATSRPVAAIAPHLRSLLDFSSELQQ